MRQMNFGLICIVFIPLFISLAGNGTAAPSSIKPIIDPGFDPDPNVLLTSLVDNHKEIASLRHRMESAKEVLRQTQALYMPSVDFYGDAGKEGIEKELSVNTYQWRHEVTIKATQLISDFGKTTHTIDRDKLAFEQSEAGLSSVTQKTLREGISAYIGIVRARERLKTALYSESRIKALTGVEKALVEKGAGLSSDVLQAKSQLAGAMALRVEAEGELSLAKNRFQAVFYHYPTDHDIGQFIDIPLPDAQLPKNLDSAIDTALQSNPDIRITRYDLDLRRKDVDISKTSYYPSLNLFGEYIDAEDDNGADGYRRDYSAGVEFSYNIFSGGGDTAAIRSALAAQAAAENYLDHAGLLVQEQVRNAWDQFSTLTRRKEMLDTQVEILKNFLELAKKERKMGTRSLLDVLNGEVNYINAQATAIAAGQDMKIAAYNLLYAMGQISLTLFAP